MSHDAVSWWREQKRQFSIAEGNASTGPLYAAGDALAAECERLQERVRRVEAFVDELESETFPRTPEGQAIESTQLRCAGKLRAALGGDDINPSASTSPAATDPPERR